MTKEANAKSGATSALSAHMEKVKTEPKLANPLATQFQETKRMQKLEELCMLIVCFVRIIADAARERGWK